MAFFRDEPLYTRGNLRRIKDKRLGQILIDLGYINQEQLDEALKIQRKKNGNNKDKVFSGEILIKLGYVNEEAVFEAFVTQYRFPFLPLDRYEFDLEVIGLMPSKIARKHLVVPIDKFGNILTVAISNPFNTQAIKEIEQETNFNVQPFVADPIDIKLTVEKYYGESN